MFLTVLVHGVVTIDGKEDLTQDLLVNGYQVSTDPPKSHKDTGNSDNNVINALEKMIADAGIADDSKVENITQGDHMYTGTIFEILRPSKPARNSWSRRRTFSFIANQKSDFVYMAQRRIIDLFSRREGSSSIA